MFKPNFTLSSKLLGTITQIERLYGQIEALKLPKKLELNLRRDNLIQSSYASNKIEGNPLTLPEVTNLLLDDRVPVNRDEKEVVNYFGILTRLDGFMEVEFDIDLVKKLHLLLMDGVDKEAGKIRNEKVVVGKYHEKGKAGGFSLKVKHEPPYHKSGQIKKALIKLLDWENRQKPDMPAVLRAGVFHHQFVYLHPFEDGNGRVCRILTALILLKLGYKINKYFVLDDYYDIDRTEYSDKLNSADDGDKTEWLEYFAEGMKYSLQSALAKFENAMKRLAIKDRPTAKERLVLKIMEEQPEITSTEIAGKLNVSRQQAHNLLRSLVSKGLIEQKGTTKSSYYVFG